MLSANWFFYLSRGYLTWERKGSRNTVAGTSIFFPTFPPLLKLLSEKLSVKNKLLFTWFVNAGSYKMVYVQDTQLKR
jgi:hypothetical protein